MGKQNNNDDWSRGPRRFFRFHYLRILRLKASPHEIAMGMALGIFIGFMPIIPAQTVTVLILALIFRASKLAAAVATWISNPFNMPLFYSMLYFVGRKVFPFLNAPFPEGQEFSITVLFETGWNLFVIMLMGGFVLGIPSSIVTYFVSRKIVAAYQRRKALRMRKKRTRG
jgi:uncharacterized protein (TIGR03546 family)